MSMPDPPESGKGSPMANVLADEKRLEVLAVLVSGGSVRAAERQRPWRAGRLALESRPPGSGEPAAWLPPRAQ